MADWSSLPPDLIRRVGDRLLVDTDVDFYMNMRAVCHNWRSAAADPCRCGDDTCFRTRQWAMLDEASKDDDTRLFVNVSTARFLRRRLPLLRFHVLIGFSDGLLVLGDRPYPHRAVLFNPFTGSMVKFAAAIRPYHRVFVGVTTSHPPLLFAMDGYYGLDLWCANPASERFWPQGPSRPEPIQPSMLAYRGGIHMVDQYGSIVIQRTNMLAYRGDVYMVDEYASIVKIAAGAVQNSSTGELVAEILDVIVSVDGAGTQVKKFKGCNYLAESAGDLLLIRLLPGAWGDTTRRNKSPWDGVMEVYRVDVERKVVETVNSIGGRALFLGARCVSVDASKFPSIDGDCVYYTTCQSTCCKGIYRYDLGDGTKERVFPDEQKCHEDSFQFGPFSIVQVLHTCCNRGRSRCISSGAGAGLNLPCEGWSRN